MKSISIGREPTYLAMLAQRVRQEQSLHNSHLRPTDRLVFGFVNLDQSELRQTEFVARSFNFWCRNSYCTA